MPKYYSYRRRVGSIRHRKPGYYQKKWYGPNYRRGYRLNSWSTRRGVQLAGQSGGGGFPHGGVPQKLTTKMRYTMREHSVDVTGYQEWVFRMNSPYDPDSRVGGSSATYHTNFAYLYQYYKVFAGAIRVTTTNHDADHEVLVTVLPTAFAATFNAIHYDDMRGMSGAKTRVAANEFPVTVKQYASVAKIYGERDLTSHAYGSAAGGNPANETYWHVILEGDRLSPSALDCSISVEIDFYVQWYTPTVPT